MGQLHAAPPGLGRAGGGAWATKMLPLKLWLLLLHAQEDMGCQRGRRQSRPSHHPSSLCPLAPRRLSHLFWPHIRPWQSRLQPTDHRCSLQLCPRCPYGVLCTGLSGPHAVPGHSQELSHPRSLLTRVPPPAAPTLPHTLVSPHPSFKLPRSPFAPCGCGNELLPGAPLPGRTKVLEPSAQSINTLPGGLQLTVLP